ncbi:MAG: TolC family protein [Methylotenera sp.]|nr:TolC family protein [Methylotenera sp.]
MSTNIQLVAKNRALIAIIGCTLALSGCATFSKDGGFGKVQEAINQRIKQEIVWPKTADEHSKVADRVKELIQQRMDLDNAVQLALLNNRGLQASYYELGISEADLVQAGRFPNPKFSMLYTKNGGEYNIEQTLTFNIFSLLTIPKMKEIERQRFERSQQSTAIEVLRLANQTRVAYFNAVAATEQVRYSEQVKESAEASAELARRMVKAGNFNKLEQAREQGFYAEAALDSANARTAQVSAFEALSRLLGVSADDMTLEERLPDLPKALTELQPFEKTAFEQRLDLKAMKSETEILAKQLGLTKTTRFINVLEIGPARVLEGRRSSGYKNGVDISFELPLFDWGGARVARAESIYMQSVNRTAQMAVNAQSEVREAYNSYRSNYDIAKHYRDEIIPLHKKILTENQLRYNGMLISPFELLADARSQVTSVKSYIESLKQFWLSESALHMTLIGSGNMREGN